MTKLLVVVLVVVVALWALLKRSQGARRGRDAREAQGPAAAPSSAAPPVRPAQDMVRCAHCGLHLPSADAVHAGGRSYCGAEHAAAGPRGP